ncbi:glycosyltransferase family 1 protein [Persicobacter psychrovividus]|uniref:Glycosyl transferase n=1 Tax=Persicobacter psychrovividus TaxID=387638 RepID=A0ABN6L727_9BACT|nr:glycosyl transferase [Persicobacter psychrovividus]
MRIGIEARRIFRAKKHGLEIALLETLKALQELDTENEYFVFAKKGEDMNCIVFQTNFNLVLVSAFTELDWEQFALPRAVANYQLDLLHCTSNTAPTSLSVPLFLTLHDIIFFDAGLFEGTWYQNIGNAYRRQVVPSAVNRSTKIFTVSATERKRIINRYPACESKIEVLYNGLNPIFKEENEQIRRQRVKNHYQLPSDFVFFIGNEHPRKNAGNMLQAYLCYVKNSGSPLPLVCPNISQETVKSILQKSGDEQLLDHFYFPSYISFADLPVVYGLATVFLFPSLEEGFGLPIIESMACGTPVITSDCSCMPEIAADAAMMVNPHHVEEIFTAIQQLTADRVLLQRYKEKGLQRALAFSWAKTAQQLLEAYQEFTQNSRQSADINLTKDTYGT